MIARIDRHGVSVLARALAEFVPAQATPVRLADAGGARRHGQCPMHECAVEIRSGIDRAGAVGAEDETEPGRDTGIAPGSTAVTADGYASGCRARIDVGAAAHQGQDDAHLRRADWCKRKAAVPARVNTSPVRTSKDHGVVQGIDEK